MTFFAKSFQKLVINIPGLTAIFKMMNVQGCVNSPASKALPFIALKNL